MRMPTRYMRDETQRTPQMLSSMRMMETANCHAGRISDPMRRNMMIGVQGGKNDAAMAPTEFESLMISMIMAKLSQMGTAASGVYICSSCSVSQVAARPAKSEL